MSSGDKPAAKSADATPSSDTSYLSSRWIRRRTAASSSFVQAFDVRFRVLSLRALIESKRATGRPKDIDQLPELEALLALTS
jgi:hypothetical protein